MRVALVYDRVNKWGGAERVLLALHKIFPQAPLFTSVYDSGGAPWAKKFKVIPSFLQRSPFSKKSHEVLAPLMPLAFESHDFSSFDLVISVTSEAAKGVIIPPSTQHICLCLTPTRYLYSGYTDYFEGKWFETISKPVLWYIKKWDKAASARPDKYIAISTTVKNRIKNIYGRTSTVVYPPIAKSFFTPPKASSREEGKNREFFLIVSRLVDYKRIDLAIRAANRLKVRLKIVGQGRLRASLEKIAGPTIEFEGFVTENELIKHYSGAKALIFPGNEDLGLTMIEAQACGTPVIALRKGGATELVKEGITGEFFEDQTVDSLAGVMEKFDFAKYNSKSCINNAKRFDFDNFKDKLLELTNK